jgi:hypothetical protein
LGNRHPGQIKQQHGDQLRRPNKAAAPRSTEKDPASTASELTRCTGAGNDRKSETVQENEMQREREKNQHTLFWRRKIEWGFWINLERGKVRTSGVENRESA